MSRVTRRMFNATAGIAIGIFATSRIGISAQEATPERAVQSLGYVSTRIRSVASADQRERVNELVRQDFAPAVEALEGFHGYLLGDVIDQPEHSLSVLVLEEERQTAAFLDLAKTFIEGIADEVQTVDTVGWDGDLLIRGVPSSSAMPEATPASESSKAAGYAAVRVYRTPPGVDVRESVPQTTSEFVPILAGLPGFKGFLWYPTGKEIVAISLYDSEESAMESTNAARDWVADFATKYTEGDLEVINAQVVYANLPILG